MCPVLKNMSIRTALRNSFLLLLLCTFTESRSQVHDMLSQAWVSDNGDGTYKNPVINADYSDPDVVRVGNDFYLTSSSFNCVPGLPVLHSKDLVNWTIIGHALPKQEPTQVYDLPMHGKGVWAPVIRYHNKTFYIYWGDPDFGIFMVKAKDAKGPWEKPVLVAAGKGKIDPCPFWDDNGNAYLVHAWAGSRVGVNSLLTLYKMNAAGTALLDEGVNVFSGHDHHHTVEGPKLYKRNGYYYIFAPAGGVATGWQLVLRSKNIYGPYEDKIVMDQGTTLVNGPHQGAWVNTPSGEDWFLHFQDKLAYGRVLHLQPMAWKNNWPVIGNDANNDGKGEPVLTHKKPIVGEKQPITVPATSDEFNNNRLGLQWQWHANPHVTWSILRNGALRLFAVPQPAEEKNFWHTPNLLMQKFPAENFTATTKLSFHTEWEVWEGKNAGLLVMGNDYAYCAIAKKESGFVVRMVQCKEAVAGKEEQILEEQPLPTGTAFLKVEVTAPGATCTFSYSEDGIHFKKIGRPFTAQPDKWIGAKMGLFCTGKKGIRDGGYADIDWFRVTAK